MPMRPQPSTAIFTIFLWFLGLCNHKTGDKQDCFMKLLITSLWPDVEFLEVTWPERWRPGDELNVMDERFEGWLRETGSHDADGRRGILEPKKRDCPEKMETPHRREFAEQSALTGALSNIAHYKNVNKHKQRVCPLLLSSLVLLLSIYHGLNWAKNVDTQ